MCPVSYKTGSLSFAVGVLFVYSDIVEFASTVQNRVSRVLCLSSTFSFPQKYSPETESNSARLEGDMNQRRQTPLQSPFLETVPSLLLPVPLFSDAACHRNREDQNPAQGGAGSYPSQPPSGLVQRTLPVLFLISLLFSDLSGTGVRSYCHVWDSHSHHVESLPQQGCYPDPNSEENCFFLRDWTQMVLAGVRGEYEGVIMKVWAVSQENRLAVTWRNPLLVLTVK